MIGPAEIETMTPEERLRVMELLWSSLTEGGRTLRSPEWHQGVIHDRLAKADSADARFFSLDEMRKQLRRD